jgi:hypothetical protein
MLPATLVVLHALRAVDSRDVLPVRGSICPRCGHRIEEPRHHMRSDGPCHADLWPRPAAHSDHAAPPLSHV